jgi:hypothetical protein
VDVQLDAGQVGAQHPDQRRQQVIGGRPGEPDRDPAQHPVGHLSGLGDRVVHLGQDGPGPGQEAFPGRGELHLAGGAVEQHHPHLRFQRPDLLGQRGLSHLQPLRGPAEVCLLGHGHEVLDPAELHRRRLTPASGNDHAAFITEGRGYASG